MDATTSNERPVTSKSRGICRYCTTPRGCFAGDNCKFLHGEAEKLTPYDQSKMCRYYAAGYCKRGAKCWFRHVKPEVSVASPSSTQVEPTSVQEAQDDEDEMCSICYEKPMEFGLLGEV